MFSLDIFGDALIIRFSSFGAFFCKKEKNAVAFASVGNSIVLRIIVVILLYIIE
jgi:hypothetical protein